MNTHYPISSTFINFSNPNSQPTAIGSLRRGKALILTLGVMAVTVMALAASNAEAQPATAGGSAAATKLQQQNVTLLNQTPVTIEHSPVMVALGPKAANCVHCGTVESVVAVQRQGRVKGVAVGGTTVGIGTVAGGVVGGVLGNQVGGGNGKTAMTVLGAAGGAYAGNRIEKNMKKTTHYQMRVRMKDGSVRSIEQASAVPVGSRVIVDGNTLRLRSTARS